MPRTYKKEIRETLNKIWNENPVLYKKVADWLLDKQCCNNIVVTEDKVGVIAFKDNLVVCTYFDAQTRNFAL